ncbi:MAG: alpha-2-macroglobulin family protein, partial [Candidatus Kapaibacterium sp.]
KLDKDTYEIPGEISANIHAVNLFGPPASDRKYEMEMNLRRTLFRPKGYDEYGFAVSGDDQRSFESAQREGRTDPEGNATEKFALKEMLRNRGYFKADILAKVFDETGRTVSATQTAEVFTQNVFFGIGEFDSWVSAKSPLSIPLAAVDRKGNPAKATAVIRIIKTNWETVMRTNPHGGSQFESRKIEDIVSEKKIEINKKYVYKFTPELSGSYEIRVLIPGSEAYNSRRFYAYRSGYTSPASFEVDKEGKIDITADKDAYASGDRAKLLFKTPFDGKMLVTIECDKVYEYYNLEVSNQSASLEVRLKDEYIPNIYISAILYKPVDDGSMPLTVAYGFKPLKVEKPEYKLPLKIVAAEQVRSKSTQKIKIKTKPMRDINVTIAAVDEGILQVSGFETPDPYGYFYQQRALAIDSYTMYPFLFPELRAERHSYGYGEAADAYAKPGRLNPMSNKRFRLVAFWSGILKSNTRGEAEYSIAIPQFSGTLRIMACAYHDRAFGSAEQSMQVADPIVISPGLPRFLSPDDEAIASVMIANTEKSDKSVKISVESSGPVEFINYESKSLKIEANSEKMLEYRIRAKKSTGLADVTFKVSAGGNTYTHSTNLPVRAPVSLRKISGEGEIAAGKSKQIMIDHDFIEGSARGYITLASSPVVNQLNHLEYLVEYPHGCIEQTVSAAFPQLYFAELARAMDKSGSIEIAESRENISRAISKIQAMQLPGGGMAFWMGGGRESWWGTAYAAHFMIEARRAGYHVSQSVMDQAFNYLERKIGSAEKEVYHYQKDGHWQKREIAPREVFYSLYILALANRSDISTMNYYRSRPEMMSPDSRFMLAAAYKLAGDTRTFAEILPADFPDSESRRQSGGSFASPVRDPGIALNTLLEADPTNKRIPQMARHLSRQLASQRWLSTQDRAWGLLSLGKIAAREASPDISAEVFTGGRKIGYINKERRVFSGEIDIDKTKVSASGSGRAWYFWEAEGLPKEMDTRTEDSFIRARRQYYDANGNRINNTFAQGDLIVVEITIEALEKGVSIENIAITDLLPAGLEVENPRIRSSQALKWLKEQDDPEHFDYRDDRINIFTNLNENNSSQRFYYLARAVTRGEFSLGQIHADAMYNGEYHSYSGGGRVYVK